MTASAERGVQSAARELAQLLALARRHWGIPDAPRRTPDAPASAATERTKDAYLPQVIELYRAELTNTQIASRLDLPLSTIQYIIHAARSAGTWPAELTRRRGGG